MSLEEEFFQAIHKGDKARVSELLDQGVSISAADKNGYSAMHFMATGADGTPDSRAVGELLFDRGAEVNARGGPLTGGSTPLHSAALKGNLAGARFLLEHGADVNAQDSDRRTPLHTAVAWGHKAVVELLLAHGTNTGVKDLYGETPLQTAEKEGYAEIAAVLRQAAIRAPVEAAKGFGPPEASRKAAAAKTPEQLVADVLALVRRHRDDDAGLESALTTYFGARDRKMRPAHPRVNPAGGFSMEHD